MNLTVAIRTEQFTLFDLFPNLLPTAGVAPAGNPEVFLGRVPMVELQGVRASIISTSNAPAAQVLDRHLPNPLSTLLHSLDEVATTICVASLVSHRKLLLDTAACSTIELPRSRGQISL